MSEKLRLESDIVLIGAGIMSATLGLLLKELNPKCTIHIFERLDRAATESSDAWNNAGTGHSAFCELNYTPQLADHSIDISKALKISESFEVSRQFWSYLIKKKLLKNPKTFIRKVPHMSFVWGNENIEFLHNRYLKLKEYPLFAGMQFSTNTKIISEWAPLIMENRKTSDTIACTKMDEGTDVNFGSLTRSMFQYLSSLEGVHIHYNHEVKKLKKTDDNKWRIKIENLTQNSKVRTITSFVFIGAGGGSLLLLEKANIPEGEGYGGFPVSGQWLKCTNPEVIAKHQVKVYGKASVGAPPMSVPHIDTRIIDGKKALLFGPYAGFSTKFLKNGSYLDLFDSIQISNLKPMIGAGISNISLTKYLIEQVFQSDEDRMNALKEYVPSAKEEDWTLENAGQRVQVIKKDENGKGILEFGTEVIASKDGSLAALLGASPGASTATSIMLELLEKCFQNEMKSEAWQNKLKEIIPAFNEKLNNNLTRAQEIRNFTNTTLELNT
ncbi:malate:quinone oxidoreductase [Flavobacterium facile]|uniref:malate:quinone oxidoreductase n=1 Tax=Flavobacterium facile TaxID=2893174 RepID=UPI002E79E598|nr:malate:quinone oxidoreductase [Flavobacterium sp. T-12]